jgi:hypothetical protein
LNFVKLKSPAQSLDGAAVRVASCPTLNEADGLFAYLVIKIGFAS